jgi:two-component system chemotaxis sensor kinase CheA
MDDLLVEFVAETREMLSGCEAALVAWEADPSDRARLDMIFRLVHTVKGNCGFFDFPALARLSHAAESALAEVRAGRRTADPALVGAVLAVIDRIAEQIDAIDAGKDLGDGDDDALIDALDREADELPPPPPTRAASASRANDEPPPQPPRSIRLPVELLDRAMNGVSDMVLARNELAKRIRDGGGTKALTGPFERLSGILAEVRDAISHMRMNRIDHVYQSVPRMVRDLSAELGKQVMVDFDGGEVELDREIMDLIRDPITHVVRNALDHGIEPPAERIAAGKREIGLLSFSARHAGNHIVLTIEDDGRGLDANRLAAKAVENGLFTDAEAAQLSLAKKHDLLFEPGLSTAREVSAVSGRGVGMDVVRANIERLGGSIQVSSKPGTFTAFQLTIPLTLSIVPGLTVELAGQQFAIPQANVVEIARARNVTLLDTKVGDITLVSTRDDRMPYLSLGEALGLSDAGDAAGSARSSQKLAPVCVLVTIGQGRRIALGVDRIVDYEDLVVKPLPPAIMASGCYSGCSMLGDGRPLLILNPREIAHRRGLDRAYEQRRDAHREPEGDAPPAQPVLLFTDLENKPLAVRLAAVDRIDVVELEGVERGPDGAFAVMEKALLPVCGLPEPFGDNRQAQAQALRLTDGTRKILYLTSSVSDTIPLPSPLFRQGGGAGCEGFFLNGDVPTGLIDLHQLFAQAHATAPLDVLGRTEARPTCRLPESDWAQSILAPLVEAAGYRIVDRPVDLPVDLLILEEQEGEACDFQTPGAVLRLHDRFEGPGVDGSIDRYDRDALVKALGKLRSGNA